MTAVIGVRIIPGTTALTRTPSGPSSNAIVWVIPIFGAAAAEGALIRPDAGIPRIGRQIASTAFAIRPQLKHGIDPQSSCRTLREAVVSGKRVSLSQGCVAGRRK